MDRLDISLFGFRLNARGPAAIFAAIVVTAMLLGYALVQVIVSGPAGSM